MGQVGCIGAQHKYTIYNPMRERTEAARGALQVLDDAPPGGLDLDALLHLQRLLLHPRDYGWGQFRDGPAMVLLHGQVVQTLPNASEAVDMAARALQWLNRCQYTGHTLKPISVAAEIVFRVTQAHPFWDGNGRVSRALGTWVLLRHGYELVFDLRLYCRQRTVAYYAALATGQCSAGLLSNGSPWDTFFRNMVGYCFRPTERRQTTTLSF